MSMQVKLDLQHDGDAISEIAYMRR